MNDMTERPGASETPARPDAARGLEDSSVAEFLALAWRAPRMHWRRLQRALDDDSPRVPLPESPAPSPPSPQTESRRRRDWQALWRKLIHTQPAKLALYTAALAFAVFGSLVARGATALAQRGPDALEAGAPYLWLGFLLWLGAESLPHWKPLRERWTRLDRAERALWTGRVAASLLCIHSLLALGGSMIAPEAEAFGLALAASARFLAGVGFWIALGIGFAWHRRRDSLALDDETEAFPLIVARDERPRPIRDQIGGRRVAVVIAATISSAVVWANTAGNRIEPPVIALWLLSAALWGFAFAPMGWNVFDWAANAVDRFRRVPWRRHRGTALALLLIMALAFHMRFTGLESAPPELYSDLVEKIQDAYKIYHQDDYRIYFSNIGGREPLHFYLLSILASQPQMEFDHYALKLMSALESLATVPLVFWLGFEVMGERRRKAGILLGLVAAGLLAASYWHVVLGRQGMRISLAPLFVALTAIFFARALRHNHRADFVKAGLALGFGLYAYQAVRMLPAPLVAGVALALLWRPLTWRFRARYIVNIAVLAFVALMVFLPLLHFWTEFPEQYLMRASTRVFGDLPTDAESQMAALLEGGAILLRNIRNVLLVFIHTSDSSWVSSASGEPAMDALAAGFMLLGAAAWLGLIASTRDPVIVFVPALLFFMLMASALALAFPVEVPSFVRASGAIPPAYLIAALPLCLYIRQLLRVFSGRIGAAAAIGVAALVILLSSHANSATYFGPFMNQFMRSSHPYSQAGRIVRGFARSDGAYGNAFLLNSPHWWDVRAVGIEAGAMFWDSGVDARALPDFMEWGLQREPPFRLDPERDLLFMYALDNWGADARLRQWFPQGRSLEIEAHQPTRNFIVYRVPAFGARALRDFTENNRN